MEEEVDPILAKLNTKNKPSPSPVVEEEDPILKKLNASKKKEPTTVEESSGVGGKAQPATAGTKPSLKESKPVEKSTGALEEYKRRQQNLMSAYQSQFQKETEPVINEIASKYSSQVDAKQKELQALVDSRQISVDAANKQLSDFSKSKDTELVAEAETKQKELLPQFLEKNKTDIGKWNAIYADDFQRKDFKENRERDWYKSIWESGSAALTKDLPSAYYGTVALGASAFNKADDALEKYVKPLADQVSDKTKEGIADKIESVLAKVISFGVDESLEEIKKQIQSQQATVSEDEIKKNIVIDNLRKAIDYSNQSAESKKYLVNTLDKVKGGDFVDYLNYISAAVGQGLGQIPASIGTRGTTSIVQQIGSIYVESVQKLAEEESARTGKEVTYEDIIRQGKDDVLWPLITGFAGGLLDAYGANKLNPFNKQEMLNSFRKRAIALGKVTGTETATEAGQTVLENLGVSKATGETWAEAFKNFKWDNVVESALQGGIAAFFMGGGGQAINKGRTSLKRDQVLMAPGSFQYKPKSPAEVVSESRTTVQNTGDTQQVLDTADKILETTEQTYKPGDVVELSTKVENKVEPTTDLTLSEQKSENKPVENPLNDQYEQGTEVSQRSGEEEFGGGEGVSAEQGSDMGVDEFNSVGENYVKRNGKWFVKDADGAERPVISDNPNKTPEESNAELADLKKLKSELEATPDVTIDLSPTGKGKIARMDAFTPEGRARKWLLSGGKLLWNSKNKGEGKKRITGIKDETGFGERDKSGYEQYLSDKKGVSVERAAEQLADFYGDEDVQKYRNALIEVFSTDPKTWYEQQVRDEDADYAYQQQQRQEEANLIDQQILNLEAEESGITETNQQLYENERRVNYGVSQSQDQGAGATVGGTREGSQAQVDPRASIRKNGNADKSKQAVAELATKNLTHVSGLGMGQNQAKGTYISTEDQNRYETEDKKPVKVKVDIQNPFVSEDDTFYNIQREIIQSRFGKNQIEDLTEAEADLLAEMVTEHFMTEGFDAIYMPQSETQEGELIVFDRGKVSFEGKKPPATPTEIETESDSKKPRNYAIADRILKSDASEAIKRGIKEKGESYIPKGLEITLSEAKNLIEFYGDKADSVVRDLTNGLTWDTRTALTAKLYEKYVEQGNNEAAVDIAMWQAEQSLQAGRASNAAKIWKMITESGEENIVLSIERERQTQRDKLIEPVAQELQQTREQIEAEIRKQVEERVQKEVEGRLKKAKLITKEKRKEIADFFDGLKVDTSNKGALSASVIPGITLLPHVWNASVDIMKQAILTGADVANAIQAGIDYIKANQQGAIDEERFKEFMAPKLEAIVPKEPVNREAIDDEKIKTPKTLKGRKKKEFIDEVIQAYNDGKLTDKKFEEIYAGKMGFKEFTEADRKRIRELATIISEAEKFENVLREDFTDENIKKYKDLIKQAKQANNLLQEFAQAPASIEDTLISIMQGNLLSPLSQVANIYYNVNYQPLRFLSMLGGSFVDFSLSKLAKIGLASKSMEERTIDPIALQKGYFKGGWNGLIEGAQQVVTGTDQDARTLREIQTNFSPVRAIRRWSDKNRTAAQKANDYVEGTLGIPAEVMFRLLNLGDKPFRRAAEMAKAMEMASLRGLKGNDLLKFLVVPDAESAQLIKRAGDEATFQQSEGFGKKIQQYITDFLNTIAQVPYVGKPAKVLLKSQIPFVKTPWNVAAETMQYAAPPVTLAIGINQIAKGNKRGGSILIGKAIVGAMIQAAAYELFIKGLITGDDDKEKKKRDFQFDNVPPANSLNTSAIARGLAGHGWETKDGDIWSPYTKMGVTGILFDHYSNTYKERVAKNEPILDTDSYFSDMITSGPKVASASLDQTFLQGTSKLLEAVKDGGNRKTTDWIITTTEAIGSILYPNTLATISKASDEYLRDVQDDDFLKKLGNVYKNKMFMGDALPAKVSIWGDKVTGNPEGRNKYVYYLFDPTKFKEVRTDDFRYKLYQDFKKDYDSDWLPGAPSKTITVRGEKIKLDGTQYELLSTYVGQERKDMTQAYINSREYERASDEEKKEELKAIYRDASELGRERFMIDLGYNVSRVIPLSLEIAKRRMQRAQNKMKSSIKISP